jgi:hypothetical protein
MSALRLRDTLLSWCVPFFVGIGFLSFGWSFKAKRNGKAATWLEGSFCVLAKCPGEDEHVSNEVHALLIVEIIGFVS